ncbi:MAG: DUF3592 domain-containing protein, partial [Eubacterium sp.]|nr:DUF3592 domain-containing protein [Eubacterium sp.]
MKNVKPMKLLIIIFLFIGIFWTAMSAIFTSININLKNNGILTQAEIIDFESYYDSDHDKHTNTIVKYVVDGEEYTDQLNAYNSAWRVGDSVDVYYDPLHPQEVKSEMPVMMCIIFGTMGVTFIVVSIVLIIKQKSKNVKCRKLIENGISVNASIVNFYENTRISVNKRYPFIIEADYNDGSNIHRFRSDNVWKNVTSSCIGETVKVYYDPNN